ncbi:hypothetical protein CDAR_51471 [Caerostris darwini]|uniref:Uncharacterized protein n=1 Tax=Caerostris darwini TaxID=1538125 RepID=A0AAV4U645_9ARAC|nr:hypothetical protein CDAR_51471 [Caerostris darwini]
MRCANVSNQSGISSQVLSPPILPRPNQRKSLSEGVGVASTEEDPPLFLFLFGLFRQTFAFKSSPPECSGSDPSSVHEARCQPP